MKKFVFVLLSIGLFLTSGIVTAQSANAATCSYASCAGKDPSATDCDTAGAGTIANAISTGTVTVALRYSSGCHAFWARINHAGVNMDGNGCQIGDRLGRRGVIQTQKYYSSIGWEGFRSYVSTWKSCGDSWDGGDGVGWTKMGEAGSNIRARACLRQDSTLTHCTSWYTRS